jgi:hypothetical protein
MLMSYEREGWVEEEPARLTGRMEVRPAAELGPIIVCLDTSGVCGGLGGAGLVVWCVGPAALHPAVIALHTQHCMRCPASNQVPCLPCCPHTSIFSKTHTGLFLINESTTPPTPTNPPRWLPAGSMSGAREVVAKAVALECMRGAHRQQRRCYLYSFRWDTHTNTSAAPPILYFKPARTCQPAHPSSDPHPCVVMSCCLPAVPLPPACLPACSGPGDVMELELGTDAASFKNLLAFLAGGFGGGTGA